MLFGSKAPAGPRGHRAYAVGDIHGRLDLLDQLLARIEADAAARAKAKTTLVFLGDLIDRGPQSAQVIERLRTYRPRSTRVTFLMGNHEEVLLRLLAGEYSLLADWLRFGGAQCAESYGVKAPELRRAEPARALQMLREAVPKSHVKFLQGFADTASFGAYLFVHAGLRPGLPLASQSKADLRWIRHPFLEDGSDHGHIVVHGHTISEQVEIRPNRIGIDTGAYRSGILTALAIEGGERWLIQTDGRLADAEDGACKDPADSRFANVAEA